MCGINFIAYKTPTLNTSVKEMCDEIIHRGPDDSGFLGFHTQHKNYAQFSDEDSKIDCPHIKSNEDEFDLYFGHRRLAIQDLSPQGHQPFIYKDKYALIYNGEIYNFKEIKQELAAKGYSFNTETDTEIIPASFEEWGVDCLQKFNGMWSIILTNLRTSEIFISRDRFGIKPLNYSITNKYIAIGSEIKSFKKLTKLEPNHQYLKKYMEVGAQEFGCNTAFSNVKRFPKSHYFLGSKSDLFQLESKLVRYWNPTINTSIESYDSEKAKAIAEEYKTLLQKAVDLRLRADVKVGSALSGGLDSSSIVSLVNYNLKNAGAEHKQHTFSSVYKSKGTEDCDESTYINEIAQLLNVNSHQIEPNIDKVLQDHQKMIYHLDTPPNATLMSSWNTYKLVKETGVTVTLDGQGADELLGGYSRYLVNHLVHFKGDISKELEHIYNQEGKSSFADEGMKFRRLKKLGVHKIQKTLQPNKEVRSFMPLNQRLRGDLDGIFNNLLHYSDRTSMAFSIESRVPFLDVNLVEFLLQVPACYKIHEGWTKFIARLAFNEELPKSITWRKDKMGWPIPEKLWFNSQLKTPSLDIINNSSIVKNYNYNAESLLKSNIGKYVQLFNVAVWENTFLK